MSETPTHEVSADGQITEVKDTEAHQEGEENSESKGDQKKDFKKEKDPKVVVKDPLDGPIGNPPSFGLLSVIGNPLGRVLNFALKPVGIITGAIGRPPGEALLAVEKDMKEKYGYSKDTDQKNEKNKVGKTSGNPQNGTNPLGL